MHRRGPDDSVTSYMAPVNDATVVNHFYSFQEDSGEWNPGVEQWIEAWGEGPMSPLLKKMRATGVAPRGGQDRATFARYVALCLVRTPRRRAMVRAFQRQVAPATIAEEVERLAGVPWHQMTPAQHRRWAPVAVRTHTATRRWWADHGTGRREDLRIMITVAHSLQECLQDYHWVVARGSSPRHRLVLGDSIVAVPQPKGRFRGLLPPQAPVFLPLSPDQVLIGTFGRPHPARVTAHRLAQINRISCQQAQDLVITRPGDDWPAGLRFSGDTPSPPNLTDLPSRLPPPEPEQTSPQLLELFHRLGLSDTPPPEPTV